MSHFWAVLTEDDEPIRSPAPFAAADEVCHARLGALQVRLYSTARQQSGRYADPARPWKLSVGEATIELRNDALFVDVPFAATTCLFARQEPERIYLSTDPRLLARSGDVVDERALYSVLQFGAIPPPFTTWRQVIQLASGRVWKVSSPLELRSMDRQPRVSPDDADPEPRHWEDGFTRRLDEALAALAPDQRPVICFSGGVDSGILALRAARMGWTGTALVHLSKGGGDGETRHAERMAAALRLPFFRVRDDETRLDRILDSIGATWYQPFGDCSVVSTNVLADAILSGFSDRRFVLDGVGADGCFGLASKTRQWSRICRIPRWIRSAAAHVYGSGMYAAAGKLEWLVRVATRAAQLPYPLAPVAQNALCGIAYDFDRATIADVWGCMHEWNDPAGTRDGTDARLASLDIGLTCARMFAQKTRALFDSSPLASGHPYLDSGVVGFALAAHPDGAGDHEPKARLKHLLAREIPGTDARRRKAGFPLSVTAIFGSPGFLDVVDEVASGRSPLAGILRLPAMRRLRSRLAAGRPPNWQACNFLWTVVFTHLWLKQVRPAGADLSATRAGCSTNPRTVCIA